MRRLSCLAAAAALLAVMLTAPAAAAKKDGGRQLDLIWTHPDFERFEIDRVAMLPCASFTSDLSSEKLVEGMLARALRGAGYRWVSAASARVLLRSAAAEDSLLKAVHDDILNDPPVDSLFAPQVCGVLRCDAVLSVRIDTWEQVRLEPGQSGSPSTTVQIRAALVDSLGRVLWTVSGSETGEGAYQSPNQDPFSTPGGGSGLRSIQRIEDPPEYRDVLMKLFDRWTPRFPSKAKTEQDS